MKKKFTAAVAAILSATMLFGTVALAADSPTASTVAIAALAGDGTTATVGELQVSADYTDAIDKTLTLVVEATEYVADAEEVAFVAALNASLPAGYQVSDTFTVSLRDLTGAIYNADNGTYGITLGVGNIYDGMTITVYILIDGQLVPFTGVVSRGKVTLTSVPVKGSLKAYVVKPIL